jgi:hypothetical protein
MSTRPGPIVDDVRSAQFTEPKAGEYSIRQIVKFGEPLSIPADENMVELPTGNL